MYSNYCTSFTAYKICPKNTGCILLKLLEAAKPAINRLIRCSKNEPFTSSYHEAINRGKIYFGDPPNI